LQNSKQSSGQFETVFSMTSSVSGKFSWNRTQDLAWLKEQFHKIYSVFDFRFNRKWLGCNSYRDGVWISVRVSP
jgi:hypothetical protein